jgi:hypothetical protein
MGTDTARADDVVALVILSAAELDWGIESGEVEEITDAARWTGEPPIDLAAIWGASWLRRSNSDRVIVVSTARGRRAFVSPRLSFREVGREAIRPLPAIMTRTGATGMIKGVVFDDAHPPLVVISPEGLARERHEGI